jgi:hypothetical protein
MAQHGEKREMQRVAEDGVGFQSVFPAFVRRLQLHKQGGRLPILAQFFL